MVPDAPDADPFLETSIPRFKELVAEAGRDPETVPVGVAPGTCDEAGLEAYARNGVAHVNIALVEDSPTAMLDGWTQLTKMRTVVLGR